MILNGLQSLWCGMKYVSEWHVFTVHIHTCTSYLCTCTCVGKLRMHTIGWVLIAYSMIVIDAIESSIAIKKIAIVIWSRVLKYCIVFYFALQIYTILNFNKTTPLKHVKQYHNNYSLSLQSLTVCQIKRVQKLIEEANERDAKERTVLEEQRSFHLAQIGNFLHPSVPISNNEVSKGLKSTGVHVVIPTQ